MNKKLISELSIITLLVLFVVLLFNPFDFWMVNSFYMQISVVMNILFFVFIGFFWRENSLDERELHNKYVSSRFAYLLGLAVLLAGFTFQVINHEIDYWLVAGILAMLLGKMFGIIYTNYKN